MEPDTAITGDGYRYSFHASIPLGQVSNALFLAAVAAEAIHGRAQVQLNGHFWTDPAERSAVIDASTEVGHTIARVFTEFISPELGEAAFTVLKVPIPRPDASDPRANGSGGLA